MLFDCTPMQPRLRSLGLGLQLRTDGEGAVAFTAGTVGNGAGLGLVQMLSPMSLRVSFRLVPCALFLLSVRSVLTRQLPLWFGTSWFF